MQPSAEENEYYEAQISLRIILPICLGIISSLGVPATLWYIGTSSGFDRVFGGVAFLFMALLWFVMVWGELRRKALSIHFKKNIVEIQTFFGYGRKYIYSNDLFTGYYIGLLPALPRPYEQLIMMVNEKQSFPVSEFYFSNYQELKTFIIDHFAYLGVKKYSHAEEFRKIFE